MYILLSCTGSGSGYKWTNITSSIMASYICEIPRSQTQDLEIMDRDFGKINAVMNFNTHFNPYRAEFLKWNNTSYISGTFHYHF